MKTHLKKIPLKEALEYFNANWKEFELKLTNYTMEFKVGENEKYLFSNSVMSKSVFIYYQTMKRDNGGEVREVPQGYKYFDFAGIESIKEGEKLFCVDINSAYLSILLRDKIILPETFEKISKRAQKKHRLQCVGMFAKNPIKMIFKDGKIKGYNVDASPFKWIFYHAVKETFSAMDAVKNALINDFIFYWVDGIFIRGDPQRAVEILKSFGLDSKIEEVKNIKIKEGYMCFDKWSEKKETFEKKILFLPKTNKEDKKDLISQIKRSIKV